MRWTAIVVGALLAGTFAPAAQAALVPRHAFEGTFQVEPLGGEAAGQGGQAKPPSVYMMGALEVKGQESGLFAFAAAEATAITTVQRIEVYELSGDPTRVDRDEFRATGRPIHRAYNDASVDISANASFFYWIPADAPQVIDVAGPLAIALPILPPDVPVQNFGVIQPGPSLVTAGGFAANLTMPGDSDAYLLAANDATSFFIQSQSEEGGQTYAGSQYLVRVMEANPFRVAAEAGLIPLAPGANATVGPADAAVLTERFDVNRFLDGLTAITGQSQQGVEAPDAANQTNELIDERVVQVFEALAPMLNGAIIGALPNATIVVSGAAAPTDLQGFAFVRASGLTLQPLDDGVTMRYTGEAQLLLFNKEFYSEKAAIRGGPLPIPVLAAMLWIIAAAAILLPYLVRLPVGPTAPGVGAALRILGLVLNIGLAVLAFVLWDLETRSFLGTSLLTLLRGGANPTGLGVGLVAGLQGLGLTLAYLLLGLPVRLIANSALRLVQLKRARGVGAGLGHVGSWGLGAPLMPLFLTPLAGLISGIGF